jgi:hypothetical protein
VDTLKHLQPFVALAMVPSSPEPVAVPIELIHLTPEQVFKKLTACSVLEAFCLELGIQFVL